MMRILIVTKSQQEAETLTHVLAGTGQVVTVSSRVDDALNSIEKDAPDIVVLNVSQHSPRELHYLVNAGKQTGRTQFLGMVEADTLANYDLGVGMDDFVVWPPKSGELATRIEQLRWRRDETVKDKVIKSGDLVIDLSRYEVRLDGKLVRLALKEYELLCYMAGNRGRVFSRETLLNKIWGYDYFGGARTVDVHITRLRNKIEERGHSFIETVRGVGYKFKE